jgi:SAM-dependent methyltransferase
MAMDPFKDYFSRHADIYAKYRPLYPNDLFAFLASLSREHKLAWDVGTGNGQAAIGLAAHYAHVIATDPSRDQITHCLPYPNVQYLVETAENNSILTRSVDLITIASALHWFNFDVFYKEANRVLKPDGIIAAWCYLIPTVSKDVDAIIHYFHHHTLNDYWLAENRLIDKEYSTIPFPFRKINAPDYFYEKPMTLLDFMGYLNTWSATQRFIIENNINPTDELLHKLQKVWTNVEEAKTVTWKLILKIGKKTN